MRRGSGSFCDFRRYIAYTFVLLAFIVVQSSNAQEGGAIDPMYQLLRYSFPFMVCLLSFIVGSGFVWKGHIKWVSNIEPSTITLNVGGSLYTTGMHTLERAPSLVALIAEGPEIGCHPFIDRDGEAFKYILAFLRSGWPVVSTIPEAILQQEAAFYGIEGFRVCKPNVFTRGKAPHFLCTLSSALMGKTVITLNVGGLLYTTKVHTLRRAPFLITLIEESPEFGDHMFIDRDGEAFKCILAFLRSGLPVVSTIPKAILQQEAAFYRIENFQVCDVTKESTTHKGVIHGSWVVDHNGEECHQFATDALPAGVRGASHIDDLCATYSDPKEKDLASSVVAARFSRGD